MEAIDQGAATISQVGDNVVAESGEPYSSHFPPLVQQPSQENTSFHSPIEGHIDDTTYLDYGPNALFKVIKPWIIIKRRVKVRIKNLETNRRIQDQPTMITIKGREKQNIHVCYAEATISQKSVPIGTKSPNY